MSGHSHYATIKRKKESQDAQRGKLFSKLSRGISLAVKTGGGEDPGSNYKLRVAVDIAKSANMPKSNIERAISRASQETDSIEEITYEGFGPYKIAIVVEVATDNRNRTVQEIKKIFERGGGNLGGPGSVSYQFEKRGIIVVEKKGSFEDQFLLLAEMGVDEIEDADESIEVYVSPDKLSMVSEKLKKSDFGVKSTEIVLKPKTYITLDDVEKVKKVLKLLEKFENHDDVQKVFANLDIPQEVMVSLSQ